MSVRLIPLGGLGEVGLNAFVVEEDRRRVLVDCGVLFPNEITPGVEVAVPDVSYLREAGGLDAVLLTHAHEDHVGALPTLLREFPVPVYGTRYTLAVVAEKLREHGVSVPLVEVTPRTPFDAGPFIAEPIRVTHSTPDAVGFAIETGQGVVIHTGDFKVDLTPVEGDRLDLARFAELGKAGVAALLSDSTNSEREGMSVSESAVAESLARRIRAARGRVFVALFASNVHRIGSVLAIAASLGRKVILAGRAMNTNAGIGRMLGIIRIPDGVLAEPDDFDRLKPSEVVVLCSGAQGEPQSALARMSIGEYPKLRVEPGDQVIFSSRSIPGNEVAVAQLANRLARRGADVVDRGLDTIHVSGHAHAEEQKMMLDAVQPKLFIPVHGEFRMLLAHARTAMKMGLAASDVFVMQNGEVLELDGGAAQLSGAVHTGRIWQEIRGGNHVPQAVLDERLALADHGVIVALVAVEAITGRIVEAPRLSSRGVVALAANPVLVSEIDRSIREAVLEVTADGRRDVPTLEEAVQRGVRRAFRRETGRRPPVVAQVVLV